MCQPLKNKYIRKGVHKDIKYFYHEDVVSAVKFLKKEIQKIRDTKHPFPENKTDINSNLHTIFEAIWETEKNTLGYVIGLIDEAFEDAKETG